MCGNEYNVSVQASESTQAAENQKPLTETARRVQSDLLAVPLEELLRYWQRLNWWTAFWPLFRHMAKRELNLPEVVILRILARRPLNISEVADSLSLSQSSASRAVDRLVGNGLISRQEDPEDRRNKRLTLTPDGIARNEEIEGVFGRRFAALVATLTSGEQDELRVLIARLLAGFVDLHIDEAERTEWASEFGCPGAGASG
jgi:DNA-binding MarR family transcriptional regulator